MVYGLVLDVIHHYFYRAVIVGGESLGSMKGGGRIKLYLFKEDISKILWTYFKFSSLSNLI